MRFAVLRNFTRQALHAAGHRGPARNASQPARQCQAMAGGREAGGHQVLVGVAFFYLTPVPFPEATGQAGFTGLTGSIFLSQFSNEIDSTKSAYRRRGL